MFSQITLVGNVGQEIELRYTPSGVAVCDINLAVNENWVDAQGQRQSRTTWWKVACWNKTAENAASYLHKGSKILVTGRTASVEAYMDREGKPAASLKLTAMTVQFLDPNPNGGIENGNGAATASNTPVGDNDTDEDIPF